MNTKFFKSLAAVAVAVLTVGCAKEQGTQEGPANVTFEIENPVAVTKAIGDGTTAKQLYYQVFDAAGNPIAGLPVQTKELKSLKTTVSFQLVKDQKYNFIFWAQTPVDGYYTIDGTEGLKRITADYSTHGGANDENRDAFFAVEKDLVISGPVSKTVTLTRPLAQVNIGTLDELKAGATTAPAIDLTGATSKVVVKDVPTVFAPLATTPETMFSGASDVTFQAAAVPTEKLSVKGVEYDYLAMNYVFAPAEGTICNLTAEFSLTGMEPISLSSPATPLKRNYRTNILGKLLTSTADFIVVVDPAFAGDEEEVNLTSVKNEASLRALFATGGSAKLADNIEVSKGLVVPTGKRVVLDLGAKTIKATAPDVKAITVLGELEINGVGTVDGGEGGDNQAVLVQPGGRLVVKKGSFTVGGDANGLGNSCICSNGGDVQIYGGTFRSEKAYMGKYYVLNQINNNPGKIVVYGGKFENYNPADGDDNLGGNFIAEGYTYRPSYDTSTGVMIYSVVKETAVATDEASLKTSLSKSNAAVSLANDVDIDYVPVSKRTTLNLNGATLNAVDPEALRVVSGGNLSITGKGSIVAKGSAPTKQSSAVVVRVGGVVNVFDGVTLDGGSGSNGNYAIRLIKGTANIYGGYFHSGNDKDGGSSEVVYLESEYAASSMVYLNVYGGVFECDGDAKYLINCKDAYRDKCHIKIYGGTFVEFNPADNTAEGEHTNFVAPGYKSEETTYNGKQAWKVVKE